MTRSNKLPKGKYLIIRLVLWGVAVFIALLPAMYEFKDISEFRAGDKFSDLLFVVVPVSALALSTTIDYLCVGFPDLTAGEFFNSLCSLFLSFIGLVTALTGFVSIDPGPMTGKQITIYTVIIGISVVTGLITEIVVTWNHHGFRPPPTATPPATGQTTP